VFIFLLEVICVDLLVQLAHVLLVLVGVEEDAEEDATELLLGHLAATLGEEFEEGGVVDGNLLAPKHLAQLGGVDLLAHIAIQLAQQCLKVVEDAFLLKIAQLGDELVLLHGPVAADVQRAEESTRVKLLGGDVELVEDHLELVGIELPVEVGVEAEEDLLELV